MIVRFTYKLCKSFVVLFGCCLRHAQDYRDDAREYLKGRAGKTDDEIDRYYVPRTFSERSAKALAKRSEAEQLQQTVAQLQQKVDQLQWKIFGTNETDKVKEFMSQ